MAWPVPARVLSVTNITLGRVKLEVAVTRGSCGRTYSVFEATFPGGSVHRWVDEGVSIKED